MLHLLAKDSPVSKYWSFGKVYTLNAYFSYSGKTEGEAATVLMSFILPLFRQDSCQNRGLPALAEKDYNFKQLPAQKIIATDDMHLCGAVCSWAA